MKHTYLFSEGTWEASGKYFDKNEVCWKLSGTTAIVHKKDFWKLEGYMDVFFTDAARFENAYKIFYRESENVIPWESSNPSLGALEGKFTICGDTITSNYISADAKITGWEVLVQLNENSYKNVGVCFVEGKKLSSWYVTLKKRN